MARKPLLNDDQQAAFQAIKKFIDHPAADTFVLKGYAGTGKTFLMQHVAKWLDKNNQRFRMLASTGRAATVLRGKTGFSTATVHGELYKFSHVDGDRDDIPEDAPADRYGQMRLQFGLRSADFERVVYIVDESSMLSSEPGPDSLNATFGSGSVLFDFFQAIERNKIIFVGDPGQLPPIGQLFSPALDMEWLAKHHRTAIHVVLNKIERVDPDNDILLLASAIRNLDATNSAQRFPKLPARNLRSVHLYPDEKALFNAYWNKFVSAGADSCIAIARANRLVGYINRAIRRNKFGNSRNSLQVGDILIVTQNNNMVPLTNGDFVEVISIGEMTRHANLHFQSVRIKALLSEIDYELLLSLDILYSDDTNNFSSEQQRNLMIEFSRKMKKLKIKSNSDQYKESMRKDSHINCLKAKFGYAVTCHKAQGGEWPDVYLFLNESMYGMPRPELFKWWYTAVTRAKQNLHLVNAWWLR